MNLYIGKDKHLVRLCPKTMIDEKSGDFLTSAFHLKIKYGKLEKYLSCDLSDFHNKDSLFKNIAISIDKIINDYFQYKGNKNIEKKKKIHRNINYFAVLDTTSILNKNDSYAKPIDSIKQTQINESHSGIYFNKNNQQIVAMILAEIANKNKSKFKDIDLTAL